MDPSREPVGIDAHDLRHLLGLLACDLRLTREQLDAAAAGARGPALCALLARLDAGLQAIATGLAGGAASTADLRPRAGGRSLADRAELVAALWERFERAGRLPPGAATLHLERPLLWPGPRAAWQSLLLNLLTNACAAAPAGPVQLIADAEGLRVRNGGRLPAPALLAALRAGTPPPPGPDGHGQGLGLIVKAAAALGLHLDAQLLDDGVELTCLRAPRTAPILLLIEDDEDLRVLLSELLRAEGFRVHAQAAGGGLAPAPGRFAAVIADLNLPGERGDCLLAAWRAADPALLTVLLTGDSAAADRRWPGVDAVLVKPGLGRLRELLAPLRRGRAGSGA
jgi:CheY-like chemotaxis protein